MEVPGYVLGLVHCYCLHFIVTLWCTSTYKTMVTVNCRLCSPSSSLICFVLAESTKVCVTHSRMLRQQGNRLAALLGSHPTVESRDRFIKRNSCPVFLIVQKGFLTDTQEDNHAVCSVKCYPRDLILRSWSASQTCSGATIWTVREDARWKGRGRSKEGVQCTIRARQGSHS